MEQTTNHRAAPSPGAFLGEESILYTTGKNIRCKSIAGVFFCPALSDKIPSDGLFGLICSSSVKKKTDCTTISTKTA